MKNKETLLEELVKEAKELKSYGYSNREVFNRISELESQIQMLSLEDDSFRQFELQNDSFTEDNFYPKYNYQITSNPENDEDYGYISDSFIDPNFDY